MNGTDQDGHSDGDEPDLDPEVLFAGHKQTGEPLGDEEVAAIIEAQLAARSDFSMRGGNLWWHGTTFPGPDDDALPDIATGGPRPACGGRVKVEW